MSSASSTLPFVQQQLIRYLCSSYLIFGLTGGCLNILLLTRQRFRTVSCCIYFIMTSITVFIALPLGVTPSLHSLNYPNPYTTIVAFCKCRTYFLQFTTMVYRWCLVAACFDRCALTSTNVRLRGFAKVRIAYRVIATITTIWLILPVHILVFFNLKGGRCFALDNITVSLYHSIYTITTGSILPVSIMIICAVLIRRNLLLKRQRRRQLNINQLRNNEYSERQRDRQIFKMLLLQVFAFVVTQTPWMLFYIYSTATIYVTNKSADRIAIEQFINFTTDMSVLLLPVLSFYLHTLASRTFRNEFMKLLHCPRRHRPRNDTNRVTPLANDAPVQIDVRPVQSHASSYSKLTTTKETLPELKAIGSPQPFKPKEIFD